MRKPDYIRGAVAAAIGLFMSIGIAASVPLGVYAASSGLVVCGVAKTGSISEATECQACHLFQLIDRVIRFLIYLAVPIVSLLFAYAGFLYFTQGANAHNEAKAIFMDAFIGFLFVLCGFLIVDTILKTLAKGSFTGPSWNRLECVSNRQIDSGGLGFTDIPNSTLTVPGSAPTPGDTAAGTLSDEAARNGLRLAGIEVNSTTNTSLAGIREDTVQQLTYLKEACNCQFIFTGGTEAGHSGGGESHSAGYKADISTNAQIDSYITSTLTSIGTRSDGAAQYRDQYGNIYAREGNHWDILVNSGTGKLPTR
jgi:hypothetical protein